MNELAMYLLENVILDFEGEVTTETLRGFLRKDDSPRSRALLQRIIEENGIDDLLLALADCLTQDMTQKFSTDEVIDHLSTYAES